jgi:hypothetical protein
MVNSRINEAVEDAVHWDVRDAVYNSVWQVVLSFVGHTVRVGIDWTVKRAVYDAVLEGRPHSGLQDFLFEVER